MSESRWPIRTLGEVAEFLDHMRRPVKESEREPGPYPYYGANAQQGWINDFIFDEPLILLAEDGGNFGSKTRPIAYTIEGKTWVNNHAHVLRPKESVDIRYLFRQLEFYDVSSVINGATRAKLNKSDAEKLPISVPSLEEQKRIAAILDKADSLRRKRQQAIRLADDFLRAVFLDMFGDPVTNPKGWDEKYCLEDVTDIASGITKGRTTGDMELFEVPYLAVSNVQDRFLKLDVVKCIEATADEIVRYKLIKSDLLLTEGGDPDKLGRGALWDESIENCIHQNHVFRVRIKPKAAVIITPIYLSWIIGSQRGKNYFLSAAKQTTGIASINMRQLKAFPVLAPPLSVQLEFEKIAEKTKAMIQKMDKANINILGRSLAANLI